MVLRVKLEIIPFGDEGKTREIARLDIFNKGKVSNLYEYGVIELDYEKDEGGLYKTTVTHLRDFDAWALVHKVLDQLFFP